MSEHEEFGRKLLNMQRGKEREIREIYYDAILNLAALASSLPYKSTIFSLSLYPLLKMRVEYILRDMAKKLEVAIVNGIDQAWSLSDDKNRVFLDRRLKNYKLSKQARRTYYDPNYQAKTTFKTRQVNGINLSSRIWKSLKPFKHHMEVALGEGIAEGMSANKMAQKIKVDLNDPDRLFRRVRAKTGDKSSRLKLSKAALDYHPGQGIYRSSFKNALRLTRTETNIAYRTADYIRWQEQPFVVGVEIRLSNAHPREDICDPLAGKYPKDFKWTGWHPQCICYQIPILITSDEMDKYQGALFGRAIWDGKSVNAINDAPKSFYTYMEENMEQLGRLKTTPYWISDNKKYITL